MPTGFVQVGFGLGQSPDSLIVNPIISLTLYDQDGNEIGFVTRIDPASQRRIDRQRHFNAADAGRIVELTVTPEDYTLTLEGFTLYQPGYPGLSAGTLIDRLFRPGDPAEAVFNILNKQFIPFTLVETIQHPADDNRKYTTRYIGCLVQSWAGTRQINQAWIAERVTVIPKAVEVEVSG